MNRKTYQDKFEDDFEDEDNSEQASRKKNVRKGAPHGNAFWMLGPQPGAPPKFDSPETLWKHAQEYFTWCRENPLISVEYFGKDAKEKLVPKVRAFTWTGLQVWLGVSELRSYRGTGKTPNLAREFSQVIKQIEQIIYTQKFEYAAAGFLKENIIIRDLGLRDQVEQTVKNYKIGFDDEDDDKENGENKFNEDKPDENKL